MPGDQAVRVITDLFTRRGTRRPEDSAGVADAGGALEPGFSTKALQRFLAGLTGRESPVLVDLGPVIGTNVTFLGERLGCKIFVEDLFDDLERYERAHAMDQFPGMLRERFAQPDESVDGIICWDLIDYLDRASAQVLAQQVARMLRPSGVLLGFFAAAEDSRPGFTKYVIADERMLRGRPYPATRRRQPVWQNREIIRLFAGLVVADSFLLKVNTREMLFRKQTRGL